MAQRETLIMYVMDTIHADISRGYVGDFISCFIVRAGVNKVCRLVVWACGPT